MQYDDVVLHTDGLIKSVKNWRSKCSQHVLDHDQKSYFWHAKVEWVFSSVSIT